MHEITFSSDDKPKLLSQVFYLFLLNITTEYSFDLLNVNVHVLKQANGMTMEIDILWVNIYGNSRLLCAN